MVASCGLGMALVSPESVGPESRSSIQASDVASPWNGVSNASVDGLLPSRSVEWVAARALERVARDESLASSLDASGYLPLLGWIADRTLVAAACLPPDTEADRAADLLAAILHRLLEAAVWAAETSDVTLLQRQLAACPPLLVRPGIAIAALGQLVLDADANSNASTIAATLRAATPTDAA